MQHWKLIALVCLINGLGALISLVGVREQDTAVVYEERFREVKGELAGQKVVGYVADSEMQRRPGEVDLASMRRFFITQYALAPVILQHSTEHEYVIGNFSSSGAAVPELTTHGINKRFASGVILFKRRER